jgi:type II secretion system protein G
MAKKNILGFTLIELLIVVAIIAILAAIAIPNFLAAQTRAKCSSAKSGLRVVTTGLESYYVDNTDYPGARQYYTPNPQAANNYIIPKELTTPIAYITSWPKDPFDRYQTAGEIPQRTLRYRTPGPGWTDGIDAIITMFVPNTFPADAPSDPGVWYDSRQKSTVKYGMWSVGPDGDFESASGVQPCRLESWYDPTNGIMSNGNICRFSGGVVTP